MALLSEDDRRQILGKAWKPLPPTPDSEKISTTTMIVWGVVSAALLGGAAIYFLMKSGA